MIPLTVDDMLSLEEYARRRKEFFDSHRRYVDRYRRVRVGPRLTLIFENRQTLWFRVQEVIRIARLADSQEVEQELNLYNRLLPGQDRLQAALLIEITDSTRLIEELAPWQQLQGEQLTLQFGSTQIPARLITSRPEDRCIGAAHWVQFVVSIEQRQQLARFDQSAYFHFDNGQYRHPSAILSEDLRQSLLDDLQLSDRDESKLAS